MDIYIPNKYTNTYYRIVNSAIDENRKRSDIRKYENHHIIPDACGGTNTKENLVLLTPREHYICHRLLVKMVISKRHKHQMYSALWSLINGMGRAKRYSPCSRIYEILKIEISISKSENMKGENNHFYGKTHSPEFCERMRIDNPARREEVKEKMRGPRPGFLPHNHFTGWSDEVKQKLSQANMGHVHSEVSKKKMSETRSKKIWIKKDGEKSKHIKLESFHIYENLGWVRGRGKSTKIYKKKEPYSDEYKIKMSKSLSNKIWIKKTE